MFIGSYTGKIQDRRRVAIPKRFADELGKKLIIAKWYEDCLVLVSIGFWDNLLNRLTGGSKVISLGVRDIERFILGSAFEVEPDSQGRIIIPENLLSYANMQNELVFVGLGQRVEVWSKDIWDKKTNQIAKTTKEFIEEIAKSKI